LKNDKVIDFLTSTPTDFSAFKNFQAEMLFNFQQESPANAKGTRDSSACMKAHC